MKIKRIASIAIIAALPLTTWADNSHIGPIGNIDYNETVFATDSPYYATVESGSSDETHIATTAYVKGAYNDIIAALNSMKAEQIDDFADLSGPVAGMRDDIDYIFYRGIKIYKTWDTDETISVSLESLK